MSSTEVPSHSTRNRLSKSRFMEGLRCPLALYLSVHRYEAKDVPSVTQQARFDMGHLVGEFAQQRYPGGVLISEGPFEHQTAIESTKQALSDGVPAIYEAAFAFDDIKIRVDVLARLPEGGFELIEVKSTARYSEEKHLPDAAVQLYVLTGCGVDVRRTTLLHLNREYVYDGSTYDPQVLFAGTDITENARAYLGQVPALVTQMKECIAAIDPPRAGPGAHCMKPYACGFTGWCGLSSDDPDLSGPVTIVDGVLNRFDALNYPLHFVDFETVAPALPLFPGTRPFQPVPVQWSMHTLHEDGSLEHAEWLARDRSVSPDVEFTTTLLSALGETGTFVHYSPYERTQLTEIALRHPVLCSPIVDRMPALASRLNEKLRESGQVEVSTARDGLATFDLGTEAVKHGCLHPAFGPKHYSIKTAIKLLARDLPPYEGLAVSNGDEAMVATTVMLSADTDGDRREQIRHDLLEYCKQDTLAMVEIFRTLQRMRNLADTSQ